MAVTVETLDKLERRITLTLAAETINGEVQSRLKKLARTVKADGFRPGKVPMSVVAQRYGYSVQYEVVNDRVGQAFNEATNDPGLQPLLDRFIQVPWRKNPAEYRAYAEQYFNTIKPLLIKAGLAKA